MVDKNIKIEDFKKLLKELKYINLSNEENYINSLNNLLSYVMQIDSREDLFEMVVEELELVRKKGLEEYSRNQSLIIDVYLAEIKSFLL